MEAEPLTLGFTKIFPMSVGHASNTTRINFGSILSALNELNASIFTGQHFLLPSAMGFKFQRDPVPEHSPP